MKKKLFFYGVLVVLVFAITEVLSFGFFTVFRDRFTFHDVDLYRLEAAALGQAQQKYDQVLGWSNHYDTPYGERPLPRIHGNALISTYGDSYTHCDEVGDDETWQAYLSRSLGADVLNFGVGGFGTGQSYLRFNNEFSRHRTPFVTLGLITENINRTVNVYRPFYYPETQLRLSKPRFLLQDGALKLQDNPVQDLEQLPRLGDNQFLRAIGTNDWWYNRDNYPELRFPYSAILLNKRMWKETLLGKVAAPVDDVNPRPWEALWRQQEPRQLMFALFERFAAEARRQGATPLILVMPQREDVKAFLRSGRRADDLEIIMQHCGAAGLHCLEFVSLFAAHVDKEKPWTVGRLFMRAHVSPVGNRLIAGRIADWISEQR
ncbi:MAG: SGNH/GDSL hydrolase family protein [Thiohalocapsa sp.]|nr:SGNH/GDSL hydrolase family protein [Thiohalocapsa sp.]MCF7989778.1 SGNH/GDSL hydrolase family protein [Thiohalocapsa sp.]